LDTMFRLTKAKVNAMSMFHECNESIITALASIECLFTLKWCTLVYALGNRYSWR
jgi:hypothetical protein